ncbi:hypothetical protein BHE74_00021906 [Ensete ventricosum]|nr:hypothetical protein BHE74_00021906 [Ensete ventricosum]
MSATRVVTCKSKEEEGEGGRLSRRDSRSEGDWGGVSRWLDGTAIKKEGERYREGSRRWEGEISMEEGREGTSRRLDGDDDGGGEGEREAEGTTAGGRERKRRYRH